MAEYDLASWTIAGFSAPPDVKDVQPGLKVYRADGAVQAGVFVLQPHQDLRTVVKQVAQFTISPGRHVRGASQAAH